MKRSELLALIKRLDHFALGSGDIGRAATILLLIAEAQPVAWYDPRWPDQLYNDDAFSDIPISEWVPLYTLPMED